VEEFVVKRALEPEHKSEGLEKDSTERHFVHSFFDLLSLQVLLPAIPVKLPLKR
jgi:hypothetical protein